MVYKEIIKPNYFFVKKKLIKKELGSRIWDLGVGIWDLGVGIWYLGFGDWDLVKKAERFFFYLELKTVLVEKFFLTKNLTLKTQN